MPDMLSRHDMGPLHVCHMSYKQIFEYRSRKTPYMYALYVAICPTNRSLQYRCRRTRGGKWRYGFVIGRQRRCVENTFCREHIL
jgi:hypothetical protein